ncbi:unnamed protein product [Withania somnifera]
MVATSILYQGLQSCMEPQLPQQHVLINKLSPPRLTFSPSKSNTSGLTEQEVVQFNELQSQQSNADKDIAGWSSIQDLSNPKKDQVEKEVYVHPQVKRSSNILSSKSLEMCTESLGSETGSNISERIKEHSFSLSVHLARPSKRREIGREHNRVANFPPPLTSLSQTNGGVQVRPHREGGHLILIATTISAHKSYLKTERTDGRLRLFLLNNTEAEAQDAEHDHVDESDDGNTKIVSENGYIRPTKCKENGTRIKGIPSWEPFWVAIS